MADDHIKIKLPQLPLYSGAVKNDDMVYVWEDATGVLKHATVGQLPFGQGGGGGQPLLGSPFKVRLGDDQVTISGGNTVVSDARLAGKTDYPVSSSQLNNAVFRDTEVTYDDVNGTVTILDFELQAGEVLVLYPDGVAGGGGGGGSLQPILDRLAALESMVAPFIPTGSGENHGRVWWTGPLSDIPLGWAIDEDWNGRVPVGYDASATEFNVMGKTGGVKDVQLSANQQGEIEFQFQPDHSQGSSSVRQIRGIRAKPKGASSWSFSHEVSPPAYQWSGSNYVRPGEATESHTNLQPYRVGCWIKYVGV